MDSDTLEAVERLIAADRESRAEERKADEEARARESEAMKDWWVKLIEKHHEDQMRYTDTKIVTRVLNALEKRTAPLQNLAAIIPRASYPQLQQQLQQDQPIWNLAQRTAMPILHPTHLRNKDQVLPTIRVKLSSAEKEKANQIDIEKLLGKFRQMGAPFNRIRAGNLNHRSNEYWLHVDCRSGYDQLMKPVFAAQIPDAMGLEDISVVKKPEMWVKLIGYTIAMKDLKNCKNFVGQWGEDTGLKIKGAQHRCHCLIWRFDNVNEATRACMTWLYFHGTQAFARPFNIMGLPFFCRLCGAPGHMDTDEVPCPRNKDASFRPRCIVCGNPDHRKQYCPLRERPHKDGYCVNCQMYGHRTESPTCKHEKTVAHRNECGILFQNLPLWATHLDLPFPNPPVPDLAPGSEPSLPAKEADPKKQSKASSSARVSRDPLAPPGSAFREAHGQAPVTSSSEKRPELVKASTSAHAAAFAEVQGQSIARAGKVGSEKRGKKGEEKRAKRAGLSPEPKTPAGSSRDVSPGKRKAVRSPSELGSEEGSIRRGRSPEKKIRTSATTPPQLFAGEGRQTASPEPPSPSALSVDEREIEIILSATMRRSKHGSFMEYVVLVKGSKQTDIVHPNVMNKFPNVMTTFYKSYPEADKDDFGKKIKAEIDKNPSPRKTRGRSVGVGLQSRASVPQQSPTPEARQRTGRGEKGESSKVTSEERKSQEQDSSEEEDDGEGLGEQEKGCEEPDGEGEWTDDDSDSNYEAEDSD